MKKLFNENLPETIKRYKRQLILSASLIFVMAAIVGSSMAYLHHDTLEVKNSFTAASAPTPVINEDFTDGGTEKKNVTIELKGDGTGSYYVRAAVVISLRGADNNVIAKVPVEDTDYTISMGSDWTKGNDGYWYYKGTLTPGTSTSNLIESCVTLNTEYQLVVDIVAQTVQANPASAAQEAWGYTPSAN